MLIVLPFGGSTLVSDQRIADFGRRVRQLRLEQNLSQEALAARAEVDRSYMGHIERGTHNVTIAKVFLIADALDLPPSLLFEPSSESERGNSVKKKAKSLIECGPRSGGRSRKK